MPVLSKEVLEIQATIECGFTLRRVRDMIRTYSFRYQLTSYLQKVHIYKIMYESVFIKIGNSDFWVDEIEWNEKF